MEMKNHFRTAFNGFNREDVVQYIGYLNSKHAAEIAQLNSELEYLRNKPEEKAAAAEQPDVMEKQAGRIRELFDQNRELEAELAQAREMIAQLESQSRKEENSGSSCKDAELEAYRRAERMEREAREKANLLYAQANGALGAATELVDAAAGRIGQLSTQVLEQLNLLQEAVGSSKQALADASVTLNTINAKPDQI